METKEIYRWAIDGLAERADHYKHLSAVRYAKGQIEQSEEYDKKRYSLLDKIEWLKAELQEGV